MSYPPVLVCSPTLYSHTSYLIINLYFHLPSESAIFYSEMLILNDTPRSYNTQIYISVYYLVIKESIRGLPLID